MNTQTSIITQHNILNPHDRMVLPTYATHSSQILDELLIADGFEITLYKNSELQLEPFDIKHGDIINVVFIPMGGGGGKSIISLVAMIGLAVFAPQLGYQLGTMVMGGAPLTAFTASVFTAGVMVAGALVINAVLSPSTPSLSTNDNLSTSTTYSWDESYNKFQQGLSIPKVFGTHKITPPLISKYIETIDNKQYFNGLYAVNDGEVNSITDIKINDETIDNFTNVTYEIRNGTLNQALISNFDNVRSDKGVNKKLSTTFSTAETTGNKVIGLTATLLFQRGLFYANDDGSIGSNSVNVVLEYSSDNIAWFPMGYIGYSTVISDASTSTLRRTFKVNLSPNKYYVRAKFVSEPASGSRYGSDCYLEYITEEIGDDFIYPSTALISIRALATDQLSGSNPKISCIVSANSSNPSLICQQMLAESGIDSVRILSSFNEWESDCTAKGYAFNGVIDTSMTLRKALDLVSVAGRGSVIQFGSKFEVIMDRAETIPVQSFMFGMGNILKDSFSQSFLPILDRANVIEATYYDADLDYEPTIIEVSNNNYDSVAEENRTSVTLVGFTNRQQAIKHCRYLLNCNRYLTETVSIEADKDSLVCKYGDIVRVSHDVPQYGFSGRIKDCTLTTVTIDREVTMESGKNYYIQLKDNENNIIEHYVNNSLSTTDTLTFKTTLTEAYTKYDNYSFGEVGKASKLFRVLRISTASDMTRKLELLEYNEDVYNDSGDIDVPMISALGLSNLRATDYIRYAKDGSIETVMQLAWSGQSISYNVSYKKATQSAYNSILSHDCFIDLIVDDTLYDIIITDTYGQSVATQYQVIGKSAKPNSVTNLTCNESGNVFSLNWDYDSDVDFKEFVILLNNIEIGRTKITNFSYFSLGLDTKTFTVITQDTSGNNSDNVTIVKTALAPTAVTNLTCDEGGNTFSLNWDYVPDSDFKEFLITLDGIEIGRTLSKNFSYFSAGLTTKVFSVTVVDTSGNNSDNVSVSITALAPNQITNLTISELIDVFSISWEHETSNDFSHFDVYQNNILIGSTNSLSYTIPIIEKTSIVSIRAVDTSGNNSEYTNTAITVAYLNDVTNVNTIYQNNELIAFWDEVVSNRVMTYEIRRGSSWATAQFIENTTNLKTTIYSNGTYLIKAFYITNGGYKIESENVAVLVADESKLSKNVLEFFDESSFLGTKINTQVTENGLTLISGENVDDYINIDLIQNFDFGLSVISQGTYESTNVVNLSVPKLCKIYSNIELEAFSINNNFDLITNVDLISSVDGYISNDFAVEIQISISQDGVLYSDWKKFINGDYIGQSFKMRLVLSSFNTLVTPIVSYFDFTIDMPDLFESGSNTSDVTTKSITYTNNFSISPEVQITILNAVQGDDAILTNETADGFDIEIKNGGSNVTRSFNYFM